MKALSIRQPWADLIIHHGKDIENRSWPTSFRGTIYVHAAKKWGREEKENMEWAINFLDIQDAGEPVLGAIIGTVDIVDCVVASDSEWFSGPYGYVLKNPKPLPVTPCKGMLGFFEPDIKGLL